MKDQYKELLREYAKYLGDQQNPDNDLALNGGGGDAYVVRELQWKGSWQGFIEWLYL